MCGEKQWNVKPMDPAEPITVGHTHEIRVATSMERRAKRENSYEYPFQTHRHKITYGDTVAFVPPRRLKTEADLERVARKLINQHDQGTIAHKRRQAAANQAKAILASHAAKINAELNPPKPPAAKPPDPGPYVSPYFFK